MTADELRHKQSLVYGVVGFIAGAGVASLMVYNLANLSANSASSTSNSTRPAAKLVNSSAAPAPSASGVVPGLLGMRADSDQHFIVMMIPHHEGAVAMADLALSQAQHPELKKLAEAIKTTQTQEIQQMQTWYQQWYGTEVPTWSGGMGWGMMHRHRGPVSGTPGMMGRGMMGTDLEALKTAPDFDRAFIAQMIPHHQMAIMMSTMVVNSATHPEIRALAGSISRSQSAEIEQMQQWYQTWYPQG